jgi:hypothetical protein
MPPSRGQVFGELFFYFQQQIKPETQGEIPTGGDVPLQAPLLYPNQP